jgi:hypothetical protein
MTVPVPSAAGTIGSALIDVTLRRVNRGSAISDRLIVLAPNIIRLRLQALIFVTLSQSPSKIFSLNKALGSILTSVCFSLGKASKLS